MESINQISSLIGVLTAEADIQTIRTNQFVIFDLKTPKEDEKMKYKNHTITKRPDGRWYARYTNCGKQHSVYGRTQTECINKLKLAIKNNKVQPKSTILFEDWVNEWIKLYKLGKIKDTSLNNIKSTIKTHLNDIIKIPINKISALNLKKIINTGKSDKTQQTIYTVLNDCFDKAEKLEIIAKNPMKSIEKPKYKANETVPLTLEQEKMFESLALDYGYYNLLLCLYQGLRIGEALALTPEDFSDNNNEIKISKSINKNGVLTKPKTASSIRTIPLFNRTKKIIRLIIDRQKSSTYIEYRNCEKIFKQIGYDCKSNMTKCLRHTFATRAMEAKIEPKVVQKWMGHSTADITLKVYTHIRQQFEEAEVHQLNNYFDTNN